MDRLEGEDQGCNGDGDLGLIGQLDAVITTSWGDCRDGIEEDWLSTIDRGNIEISCVCE